MDDLLDENFNYGQFFKIKDQRINPEIMKKIKPLMNKFLTEIRISKYSLQIRNLIINSFSLIIKAQEILDTIMYIENGEFDLTKKGYHFNIKNVNDLIIISFKCPKFKRIFYIKDYPKEKISILENHYYFDEVTLDNKPAKYHSEENRVYDADKLLIYITIDEKITCKNCHDYSNSFYQFEPLAEERAYTYGITINEDYVSNNEKGEYQEFRIAIDLSDDQEFDYYASEEFVVDNINSFADCTTYDINELISSMADQKPIVFSMKLD